jgi:hypothetical protein
MTTTNRATTPETKTKTSEKVASTLLLLLGIVVALGAYGHGFVGRLSVDAELAKHAIARDTYQMLYVVWHFVTGAMLLCGAVLIWAWARLRQGDRGPLSAVNLVAILYLTVGVAGIIYRNGVPFMSVFIIEGALIAITAWALRAPGLEAAPGLPFAARSR